MAERSQVQKSLDWWADLEGLEIQARRELLTSPSADKVRDWRTKRAAADDAMLLTRKAIQAACEHVLSLGITPGPAGERPEPG